MSDWKKKKEIFTKGWKTGLLLRASVKKTVQVVEMHIFSGKEKVPGAGTDKERDAVILLHEMTQHE